MFVILNAVCATLPFLLRGHKKIKNIIGMYILIRTLHGVYISYLFLYTMLTIFYKQINWIYSCFNEEKEVFNEKEIENEFIFVY